MPEETQPSTTTIAVTAGLTAGVTAALAAALIGLWLNSAPPPDESGEEERPVIIISTGSIFVESDFDNVGNRATLRAIDPPVNKFWYVDHGGKEPKQFQVIVRKSPQCEAQFFDKVVAVAMQTGTSSSGGNPTRHLNLWLNNVPGRQGDYAQLDFTGSASQTLTHAVEYSQLPDKVKLTLKNGDVKECDVNTETEIRVRQKKN
jgi:hypothetical protein